MSNRSRGRHRFDVEPETPPDPDEVERTEHLDAAFRAFDTGDKKTGLAGLIDIVLRDREKALAPIMPKKSGMATVDDAVAAGEMTPEQAAVVRRRQPFRAPTPYESAMLSALGARETTIDRSQIGGRPMVVPVNIASGGVYGGTVEPWRVDQRRRRNKAARRARKGRLPHRARGSVRVGVRAAVPGSWKS